MQPKAKTNQEDKSKGRVKVYCRVRPLIGLEVEKATTNCVECEGNVIKCRPNENEEQRFVFDGVLGPEKTQEDTWEGANGEGLVRDVVNGYNATVLCYGQTASGKTYTMDGPDESGLVGRAAKSLFSEVAKAKSSTEFAVAVSAVEIYMEKVSDLLDVYGVKKNLAIREDPDTGVYVAGATELFATNAEEVLAAVRRARKIRATAATGMNEGSSRSHSVVKIAVKRRDADSVTAGNLVMVDLAGSETVRKTGASGQRLEEAKTINKSLSALGQVIYSLTDDSKTHVPYRDSKLTRVLQESLGGNAETGLIVCVSPSQLHALETVSSLRFGARAKRVKNTPKVNEQRSAAQLAGLLVKAEAAIDVQAARIASLEKKLLSSSPSEDDDDDRSALEELRERVAGLVEDLEDEKKETKARAAEAASLIGTLNEKDAALDEKNRLLSQASAEIADLRRLNSELVAEKDQAVSQTSTIQFQLDELQVRHDSLLESVDAFKKERRENGLPLAGSAASPSSSVLSSSDGGGNKLDDVSLDQRPPHAAHQHNALLADLRECRKRLDVFEKQQQQHAVAANSSTENPGSSDEHARSLQQRLEQLVAVHRQLLRKYSSAELQLSEADKKIRLRDRRIADLETARSRALSAERDRLSALEAKLNALLNAPPPNKNAQPSLTFRALRGGQGGAPGGPQVVPTAAGASAGGSSSSAGSTSGGGGPPLPKTLSPLTSASAFTRFRSVW